MVPLNGSGSLLESGLLDSTVGAVKSFVSAPVDGLRKHGVLGFIGGLAKDFVTVAHPSAALVVNSGVRDGVASLIEWAGEEAGISKFDPANALPTYWREADGITAPPTVTRDGPITTYDSKNNKTGTEVEQIVLKGGQHAWNGATPDYSFIQEMQGEPSQALNDSQVIWNFFSRHKS